MSNPTHDLSTPESRLAVFESLHKQEAAARRASVICRAQNVPAAAVFALCALASVLGFACYFADTYFDLSALQPLLDAAASVPGGLWTFAVIGSIVPLLFAALLRLAITPAVKENPVTLSSWPDSEEHQLYAILKQVHAVVRISNHRLSAPAKSLLFAVPMVGSVLGGVLVGAAAGCTDGFAFGDVLSGLLFALCAVVAVVILGLLVKAVSSPRKANLTALEEDAETRRAAFKGTRKYRK